MPDRVDPPLNAAEPSTGDAVLDRPYANPEPQELPPADDSVLGFSELSNPIINRTKRQFPRHGMGNRRLVQHDTDSSWSRRTGGAQTVTSLQKEAPARRYRLWL